jgi:hypothetical protein
MSAFSKTGEQMNHSNKSKPFVYFALPNEQFTTPQLLKYGLTAD